MKRLRSDPAYLMVDLFCGSGGVSLGAELSGTCQVIAAINHDPISIQSHRANHRHVTHFKEDVRKVPMNKLKKVVDRWRAKHPNAKLIVWASMDCTHHSKAKGGQPRDADSRTLATCLVVYAEVLNPDYIQIENVEEFLSWGPLDDRGKPISRKNGQDYLRWVKSMAAFGYTWDWKILDSADFGACTSRKRLFGIFHRDSHAIWPELTHAKRAQKGKLFDDARKPWMPVRDVLELTDLGRSIFVRKKPLVDKTLKRILSGLKKHIDEPLLMTCNNPGYCTSLDQSSGTITTADHKALVVPILTSYYSGSDGVSSISAPAPTVTTNDRFALVTAFIDNQYGTGFPSSIESPAGSLTTVPKLNLCTMFIVNPQYNNTGNSIHKPAPTVIASQDSYPLSIATGIFSNKPVVIDGTETSMMKELKTFMIENQIGDVLMRMLKVVELKRIQGFPDDYILKGTQKDQKKAIGNSVHCKIVIAWLQAMAKNKQ